MTASSSAPDRIKFEYPPINELVFSLFYLPILEMKAQHVGLYWSQIRERFPICEQQAIVVGPNDLQPFIDAPGEIFPLPRFWFFSDKHPTLVQIQRNAFMLNWRRVASSGVYPHYETVSRDFWKQLEGYAEFVREVVGGKLDVVQRCELNYVNVIEPNEFFKVPADVVNVLPALAGVGDLSAKGDREFAGLNAAITHRVNPNLLVDLTIRLGRRGDTGGLALGLELKAHGAPGDLSLDSARAWYESAHDATYKLFLDVTSKQLQEKIWKPR